MKIPQTEIKTKTGIVFLIALASVVGLTTIILSKIFDIDVAHIFYVQIPEMPAKDFKQFKQFTSEQEFKEYLSQNNNDGSFYAHAQTVGIMARDIGAKESVAMDNVAEQGSSEPDRYSRTNVNC